ncbi:hypothetical protein [Bacteroides finegoldii]|uniref:hypothetical protein n=1 Tax=Bacteroides finegoldii TaxID=338188 RepID=UPI00189981AF|nr:hypothetical protein [Bacteroides finegoldii]
MIHIEELSIGNSVYLKDKVITIVEISLSKNASYICYREDGEEYSTGVTIDEIVGIPLPHQDINDMLDEDCNQGTLRAQIDKNLICFYNKNNICVGVSQIRYVHQLQNMYKALTGFTKTLDYDANTQSLLCRVL